MRNWLLGLRKTSEEEQEKSDHTSRYGRQLPRGNELVRLYKQGTSPGCFLVERPSHENHACETGGDCEYP